MTASHTPTSPGANVAFSVLLRGALPPTVVAGAVTALVIGIVNGLPAGIAALIGVALVLAFFTSGLIAVSKVVVDTGNPMLFMAVGMAVYLAQIIVLFGVLVLAKRIESFDTRSAGIAMLVCVVVWQAAQMRAWRKARVPVYDEPGAARPVSDEAGPDDGETAK